MNIHSALLKDNSRAGMDKIARYIGNDAGRFAVLMHEFLHGPYRVSQRAAFAFSLCVEAHPGLLLPWWRQILDNLKNPVHNAVIRNTLRIWQQVDLPQDYHGEIYDYAHQYLNDVNMPVAIRAFALTVAVRIALIYPELIKELIPTAQAFSIDTGPALRVRGRNALKVLTK